MEWARHRAVRDALWLAGLGLLTTLLATYTDAYEQLQRFMETHEDWQLDEILVAAMVTGWCGFVYALRRVQDLLAERRHRLRAESDVSWLSRHDPLTRLPNRAGLEDRLAQPDPIAAGVIHIDLDGFRGVNDLHGSQVGDALLVELASRLRDAFPQDWIGRTGADEFVLLSEGVSLPVLQQRGARAMRLLGRPAVLHGRRVEVGVSLGLAALPQHGATLRETLACAGTALQEAKQESRNALRLFDPAMRERQTSRARLEQALREAVESGAIRPHYQPQVDLASGRVVGFEALARWRQPDGTAVPPDIFIAAAERTGLIHRLTEQLLQRACQDAAAWPAPVRLAVNLSALQLADPRLPQRIADAVALAGLPPHRLEIEITESALIREAALAQRILQTLRGQGIRVALDDFGTGYASLSQLARFSFDAIKIDRSFIRDCLSDERHMKIVKSVLGLGQGLGIHITAEGVELPAQAELLRSLGCQHGQGYLFGAAMPAEQALRLLPEGPQAAVA
ncbi:bifunctional diguanylate cyclase/phosphodiesterase [Pseudoroseomonas cervicalis]|uniref:putative bifunctional diguanylate cyclase/phosphodiesterase n=1 Tax=Teichococcus cervicalis TaxID=204525 RepID=UPI0022F1AD62|nr:bifunctional diguanylate cyclase/phosphodiesterase [Pseudoroseomonas cervicalis]WBV44050.1 bifunctional diguanylate cyclase/phosphodiesterase [Pseudoroseomonas cervicalis]